MKTIFHVGYRKCASTFLQSVVFSRHPDMKLVEMSGLPKYVALTPHIEYDRKYAYEKFCHEKNICRDMNRNNLVLSNEGILTIPGLDSGDIARRLHGLDGSALVVIIIRNQVSLLLSKHTQDIATGKTHIRKFSEWIESIRISGFRNTYLDKAFLYENVKAFDMLFGAKNVGVFLMEDMQVDQSIFARNFGEFVGVDLSEQAYDFRQYDFRDDRSRKTPKMTRSSRWSILVKTNPGARALDRILRPVSPSFIRRNVGRITGLASPYNKSADAAVHEWIADRYRESNRRLAERLGRDLGALGYPV